MSTLSSWFIALGVLLSVLAAPLGWGRCCCSDSHFRMGRTMETQPEIASACCSHDGASSEQAPGRDQDDERRPVGSGCPCTLACCTAKVLLAAPAPASGCDETTVVLIDGPGDAGLVSDDHLDRLKRPPKAIVTL